MMAGCGRMEGAGGGGGLAASIMSDLCLFLLPPPLPQVEIMPRQENPWHRFAPATQIHGNFFSISCPHWSITRPAPPGEKVKRCLECAQ